MENRTNILDLNEYCKLEIIKYIIADCELRDESRSNIIKYSDLVSFVLAHDDLEAVLEHYYNDLYKDLEFLFVANREGLKIDFAEFGNGGHDVFRVFAVANRENSVIEEVELLYSRQSFQLDLLDNFQMIKRALENKRSLRYLFIDLKGYSLDDLNFGHIRELYLNVRGSAEALATICKSNPHLEGLYIMTTDILGRLSDIVPHCRNLKELKFVPKPDVDLAEYAPLAQLPNLRIMVIEGAFKNGSVLTTFEAIQKWQKPENEYLDIVFADKLPALSSVTLPRKDLLKTLRTYSKNDSHMSVWMEACYTCLELIANIDRAEELYATFILIEGVDFSVENGERKLNMRYLESREPELASLIKALNVDYFHSRCYEQDSQKKLIKLFGLLHPEGSFALRKLHIYGQALDQFGTSELVKILSLQDLECTFSDGESFEHLSKLTNLRKIEISVREGGHLFVSNGVQKLWLKRYMASMASELASLIKVLNVNTLDLRCSEENSQAQLGKLFGLLHPEDSFALRGLHIGGQALDQFGTFELVKIQSLQRLICSFTDGESFEHLSKLTNLQDIEITVIEQLDERSLQALCNFLNNCHGNLHGTIKYCIDEYYNWEIVLREKEISLGIVVLNSDSGDSDDDDIDYDKDNLLRRKLLNYLQRNLGNTWNIKKI